MTCSCVPECLSSLQFHAVVGILLEDTDPMVSVMKLEKAPDETYADIGGLDQQIQEIKVCTRLNFMVTSAHTCDSYCNNLLLVDLCTMAQLLYTDRNLVHVCTCTLPNALHASGR